MKKSKLKFVICVVVFFFCAASLFYNRSKVKDRESVETTVTTESTVTDSVQTEPAETEQAETEPEGDAFEEIEFEYLVFYGDPLDEGKQLFGAPSKVIVEKDSQKIALSFPKTEIPFLDEKIEAFVSELAEPKLEGTDVSDMELPEDFELKGETRSLYESYLVAESFASVRFYLVQYTSISPNYWGESSFAFNYDIRSGKELKLTDVINTESRKALEELVALKGGVSQTSIDEKMLDVWVLTDEGIRFIVPGTVYTCRADGEMAVFVSYGELEGMLTQSFAKAIK